MMRSTKYTAASLSTMPAVRVMPTPMAELVMVLMILGRMMSHRVVIAAQNRSMNRVFFVFCQIGQKAPDEGAAAGVPHCGVADFFA